MEPRIIRQDALGFDQSAIKIGVPGFSTEVTVYTTWFRDNGLKGPDPKAGQYPWIKISWPSSTSEPDSRKLIPAAPKGYYRHLAAPVSQVTETPQDPCHEREAWVL